MEGQQETVAETTVVTRTELVGLGPTEVAIKLYHLLDDKSLSDLYEIGGLLQIVAANKKNWSR